VVTYTVIVNVANPDLKLKPGMTANVSIITATRQGVLRIPNAALRFKGPAQKAAKQGMARTGGDRVPSAAGAGTRDIWILEGRTPRRVSVVPGISDGNLTEIRSGHLEEGATVIVEAAGKTPAADDGPRPPGFFR
jgi:HlyD family secretion protein